MGNYQWYVWPIENYHLQMTHNFPSNHNDIKTTKQTEKNQVHCEPSEFQIALESLGPKSWETRLVEPPNVWCETLLVGETHGFVLCRYKTSSVLIQLISIPAVLDYELNGAPNIDLIWVLKPPGWWWCLFFCELSDWLVVDDVCWFMNHGNSIDISTINYSWLVVWNMNGSFFHILGIIIIPTDSFFQRDS